MQINENALPVKGTDRDSSANIAAFSDQFLTTLDLALMPTYRRNLRLRYMANPPSAEEIEAAWLDWHKGVSGHQVYFVQRGLRMTTVDAFKRRAAGFKLAYDVEDMANG